MRKQKRYFQWIDGEMKGEVVLLDSIEEFEGETFYNFDDGEACNLRFISKMTNSPKDLKNKFMVEIESPSNPWTFEEIQPKKYIDESMKGEDIDIPSLHDILQANGDTSNIENSDIGKEKLVPPKKEQRMLNLPSISDFAIKKEEPKQEYVVKQEPMEVKQEHVEHHEPVQEKKADLKNQPVQQIIDPVMILVNSCKKHDTPVELALNMKLPSIYIANIAASEFENGVEKFIDCIVKDIDTNMIITELKRALQIAYFNSTSGEEN